MNHEYRLAIIIWTYSLTNDFLKHTQIIQIVRDAGPAKIDKIVMNYIFTDISNPKEAFKQFNQLENSTFENNSAQNKPGSNKIII